MINEVIIVGTGPSGVAAALSFVENGVTPLILDVGHEPPYNKPLECNFYEYRKSHDTFKLIIGDNYQGLHNVVHKKTIFPKLISPYMQFVIKDSEKLSPVLENGFIVTQSFAIGGLANAWGAALYRYLDDELINLPVNASELSVYYDKLTKEIGISGDDDDLTRFFGSTENLLKPLKLSDKAERLYFQYQRKKKKINARGAYMGRSRLGVLSQDYDERSMCLYDNFESWLPNLPYIYNPSFTLRKLINKRKVKYIKSVLVKSWTRAGNVLLINGEDVHDRLPVSFRCKKLVLAAGTINTSKIVLKSKGDYNSKLTLIDNALVQIPLIFPSSIGSRLETKAFGLTCLNIIFDLQKFGLRLQGSVIDPIFPVRSVFCEMFPFSVKDNLTFTRYFLPSILVMLLYFPSSRENAGYLTLRRDDSLEAYSLPYIINENAVKEVARILLSCGALTHPLLAKNMPPGYAIHYAGTLPMVYNPEKEYQCNKFGELYGEPDVHIVDGSLFSHIPAKNISLTLMANAMRISNHISCALKKQ